MFNAESITVDVKDLMEKIRKQPKAKETVIVLTDEQFDLLIATLKPGPERTTLEALVTGIRVYKVPVSKYAETIFQLGQTKNVIVWSKSNEH